MALSFWSSCLHLSGVGTLGKHHTPSLRLRMEPGLLAGLCQRSHTPQTLPWSPGTRAPSCTHLRDSLSPRGKLLPTFYLSYSSVSISRFFLPIFVQTKQSHFRAGARAAHTPRTPRLLPLRLGHWAGAVVACCVRGSLWWVCPPLLATVTCCLGCGPSLL